ncbi:hypothetical protein L4C36_11395 [Photobacterium japonica]|uniref:hypothetical protein n=1 Tax=Photobacterium japonica TaxID=2910235 RepID=UPI003D0C3622
MLFSYLLAGLSLTIMPVDVNACASLDEGEFAALSETQQKAHLASCSSDKPVLMPSDAGNTAIPATASTSQRDDVLRMEWSDKSAQARGTFWDNWAKKLDSPVVSSNSDSSFYGLGFWLPDRYAKDDDMQFENTKDWLKKYGLQMSFGVGGEDNQSPRVRFDYRWHEESDLDDVFIQVEIPFQ